MTEYDAVIVRAGHAGAQAAIAPRQAGYTGSTLLIGDEPEPPYERPALSKEYLAGDEAFDRILLRPRSFHEERAMALRLGERVAAFDPERRHVATDTGSVVGCRRMARDEWRTAAQGRPAAPSHAGPRRAGRVAPVSAFWRRPRRRPLRHGRRPRSSPGNDHHEALLMDYETIRYEVAEGIGAVTLSRPDKLNAFTARMMEELLDVADRIDGDDAVRAAVFTGDGRAFCAGADLSEGANAFAVEGAPDYASEAARDGGGRVTLRLFRCLKPLIAAINGPAVGIGATVTLPMDVRLASEAARIGFVFSRRGIVPEAASSWFLPRVVGISQALEWCYSGQVFDAAEALRGGLVRSVHAPDDLLPAARALARRFAEGTAPVSVALIRQMMWRGLGMGDPMDAHRVDSRGIVSRGRSADVAEGVNSFLEKRPPAFPDRVGADMPDFFPWWQEPTYG